jgi:diguanylate cyclase (GGDEF)-like protein
MYNPPEFISHGLVFAGLLILIAAMSPLNKLVNLVPPGSIRTRWYLQSGLIVLFVSGYLGYLIFFWGSTNLIVPGVFFFGAIFVWLTIKLSLQTAIDLQRIIILEEENITDPLIGIYNRRYMDKRLEEEFMRAKRYNLPLSLLLIDIDYFKKVNDTFGHQVGDQVLRQWGGLILSEVRASDIVARYGGEEILVIASGTDLKAAYSLAERIRKTIETHEIPKDYHLLIQDKIRFTVSIGVASLTPEMNNVVMLMKDVDCALYTAKNNGRNCVVSCDELLVNRIAA